MEPTRIEDCCGKITGRVLAGKSGRSLQVWAEDVETGRVSAEILTSGDGSFRLEGIPAGEYRLYAQGSQAAKLSVSAESLGRVTVEKGRAVNLVKRIGEKAKTFELKYIGFNGQLSELAVSLNKGKSYTVYIGGKNLDPRRVKVELASGFLSVSPETIASYDYGDGLSVISFEVIIKPGTPPGEYSVSVESDTGERRTIIGGLTIEEFSNPWNIAIVPEN